MEPLQYKGYTIEEDYRNPNSNKPDYMFYPTAEGIQHDADCDQDGFFYTGNCQWDSTLEGVMAEIDELTNQ